MRERDGLQLHRLRSGSAVSSSAFHAGLASQRASGVVHPGCGGSVGSFILFASLPPGRLGQGGLPAQDDGDAIALRLLHRGPLLPQDRTGLPGERGVQGDHWGQGP